MCAKRKEFALRLFRRGSNISVTSFLLLRTLSFTVKVTQVLTAEIKVSIKHIPVLLLQFPGVQYIYCCVRPLLSVGISYIKVTTVSMRIILSHKRTCNLCAKEKAQVRAICLRISFQVCLLFLLHTRQVFQFQMLPLSF